MSSVRFRVNPKKKTTNSNLQGFELDRPLNKGTELLFQALKTNINQIQVLSDWLGFQHPRKKKCPKEGLSLDSHMTTILFWISFFSFEHFHSHGSTDLAQMGRDEPGAIPCVECLLWARLTAPKLTFVSPAQSSHLLDISLFLSWVAKKQINHLESRRLSRTVVRLLMMVAPLGKKSDSLRLCCSITCALTRNHLCLRLPMSAISFELLL